MAKYYKFHFILFVTLLAGCQSFDRWTTLEKGLSYIRFDAPQKAESGDSKIDVIKINPQYFDFKLICKSEFGGTSRTVRTWCKEFELFFAINGGMYQTDHSTSVGLLIAGDHINNPTLHERYKAVLAFHPTVDSLPPVQIIDLEHQDIADLRNFYKSFLQNIRMVDKLGNNVVAENPTKKHPSAAVAIDANGNVLFIFSTSLYTMFDFTNFAISLPLSIQNMMYLEGGPIAEYYINTPALRLERNGNQEFPPIGVSSSAPIPNVLGITKIHSSP